MASPPPPGPPPGAFDPLNQPITLLFADGQTPITLYTGLITQAYLHATSLSILYGSQLGACFMMLCVVLAMTPRVRFRRLPTLISIAALSLNLVRMVLLAVYFTTTWMDLYVLVSQDPRFVSRADVHTSVAATALSVPVTMLILAALCVQAWSMLRLWLVLWKLPACLVSAGLVVVTVTFSIMTTIIQANVVLYPGVQPDIPVWVRMAYLSCITASICWFCFLFNIRLVMHMWTNRSILPSLKGLKAMDVLVITNGILMFVPVVFAALEFYDWDHFESGSMTQTSVILVLPLGTLVAQRLANPGWFDSSRRAGDSPNSTGATGSSVSRGGMSGATAISTAKRPLLWSARGSAGRDTDGVHRGGQSAVSTHITAASDVSVSEKGRAAHVEGGDVAVDRDLARIASGEQDLERGLGHGHGGVRVDYGIERTEERLPSGGS